MAPKSTLLALLAVLPSVACFGAVEPSDDLPPFVVPAGQEAKCSSEVGAVLELAAPSAMESRADGSLVIAHGSATATSVLTIARWGDDRRLRVVAEHPQKAPVVALSARGDAFTTADGKVWTLRDDGPPALLAEGRGRVRAVSITETRAYWSESGPDGSILVGMGIPGGAPERVATLPGAEAARHLWVGGQSLLYALDVGPRTRIGSASIPSGDGRERVFYEGIVTSDVLGTATGVRFGTPSGIALLLAPRGSSDPTELRIVGTESPVLEQDGFLFHDAPSLQLREIQRDGIHVRADGISGVANLRTAAGCALWLDRAGGREGTGAVLAVSL